MALNWITVNENLKQGISLINLLNTENFENILYKVALQIKGDTAVNKDEISELKETVSLSEDDLKLLIQSLAYILKQASKVILKPTTLQQQLIEVLKVDTEKSKEIVRVWADETKVSFNLETRKRLDEVTWELNLETASNVCPKTATPSASLQLNLLGVTDNDKDNVILELNEQELLSLYKTVENIQIKLDGIHKAYT